MDFLKIRNKAKARSAEAARPADASAPPLPAPAAPATAPASEAEALDSALARIQDALPLPDGGAFTTWRPGAGAPPALPPDAGPAAGAPGPSDFSLVRPPELAPREPVHPPPEEAARAAGQPEPLPADPAPARPATPPDPLDVFFYRDDEEAPPMPGFEATPAGGAPGLAAADVREEYITFLLGAEEYAVAIERVKEVLRCPPVTEVPRAPAHVCGIVSVRGEVVAVVEPRRRLGLPGVGREPEGSRLLVVDVGDGPVGLLVDAVTSVVRLRAGSIEPCPQGIGGTSQEFLAGIGRERDRLFTVLDLGALLRRAPAGRRRAEGPARA